MTNRPPAFRHANRTRRYETDTPLVRQRNGQMDEPARRSDPETVTRGTKSRQIESSAELQQAPANRSIASGRPSSRSRPLDLVGRARSTRRRWVNLRTKEESAILPTNAAPPAEPRRRDPEATTRHVARPRGEPDAGGQVDERRQPVEQARLDARRQVAPGVPRIAPAASHYAPDHARLPLTGFSRLYEAQLRS
jgi:hypothetical protein